MPMTKRAATLNQTGAVLISISSKSRLASRLAPDVIILIVQLTLNADFEELEKSRELPRMKSKGRTRYIMGAPWKVAQINRFWREAIISTPSLWGRMNISHDEMDRMVNPHGLLELMMTRSDGMTLNIRWTQPPSHMAVLWDPYSPNEDAAPPRDILGLAKILISHCHRWRSIDITGDSTLVTILNTIKGNVNALEKLSLDLSGDFSELNAFSIAPKLRHIALADASFAKASMFPASALTQYHGTHLFTAPRRHITDLRSLSNLVQCSLSSKTGDPTRFRYTPLDVHSEPVVYLPHLTALRTSDIKCLALIVAPRLKHLDVSLCGGSLAIAGDDDEPVSALVNRSSCALESLRLWAGDCTGGSEILRHLPTLKLVHTEGITYRGLRLVLNLHRSKGDIFLPFLETFVIDGGTMSDGVLAGLELEFPMTGWTRYRANVSQPSTLKMTFSPPPGDRLERRSYGKDTKHRSDRTDELYPAGLAPDTEWPMIGNGFWGDFPTAAHDDMSARETEGSSREYWNQRRRKTHRR